MGKKDTQPHREEQKRIKKLPLPQKECFKDENLFDKLLLKYSKQWPRLGFISHAILIRLLIFIFSYYGSKFGGQNPQSGTSIHPTWPGLTKGLQAPSWASTKPRIFFPLLLFHCSWMLYCFLLLLMLEVLNALLVNAFAVSVKHSRHWDKGGPKRQQDRWDQTMK